MAFISIEYKYNECPLKVKYERITLKTLSGEKHVFDSGNFIKDWYAHNRFIYIEAELAEKEPIMNSSSIDHFIMNTESYESKYLNLGGEVGDFSKEYNDQIAQIEFFVNRGTDPTWEEFKEYCGDTIEYDEKKKGDKSNDVFN